MADHRHRVVEWITDQVLVVQAGVRDLHAVHRWHCRA
jgi:hypothetical protein